MKVKIHRAEYVTSAPSLKECPDFEGTPEVVFVGRSNVGKSSFINSLTQRKNLARTSNTPGKTRHINFYDITYSFEVREGSENAPANREGAGEGTDPDPNSPDRLHRLILVDLPGYGYAKVSKTEQEKWRKNLEAYLLRRDPIRLVVQLIDARHGPQENDIRMFEWLEHHGRRTQVILTKADKLSRNEAGSIAAKSARVLDQAPADLLVYSAETHATRDQAWRMLLHHLAVTGAGASNAI